MNKADKEVAAKISAMRSAAEAEVARLLDEHLAKHYPALSPFWKGVTRAAIETESWPAWKRGALNR